MKPPTDYQFHKVASLDEFADGTQLEVSISGWDILVCRYENKIYAVENRCSHQDKRLAGARIRKGQIICPVHGARFDLASGAACSRPATRPIITFAVRELDGVIEVAVPTAPPGGAAPAPSILP